MTTETIEEQAQFDHECDIAADEAERNRLKPGDVVRLKSGGPAMTVELDFAVAHCTWIVDRDNPGKFAEQVQSHSFAAEAVQRVGGKDSGETRQAMEIFKQLGKGRAVVVGDGEVIIPLTRAEELELRAQPVAAAPSITRFVNGVKTTVQVEPGQSAAEVLAQVATGKPTIITRV